MDYNKLIIILLLISIPILFFFIMYNFLKKKTYEGYTNKKINIKNINNNKSEFSNILLPEYKYLEEIKKKINNNKKKESFEDVEIIKYSNEFKDNIIHNINKMKGQYVKSIHQNKNETDLSNYMF